MFYFKSITYIKSIMTHLNDHDPANTRAITRSRLGLGRETQQYRTCNYPHPRRGCTCGYPLWLRTIAINNFNTYGNYRRDTFSVGCSSVTVRRWQERIMPY